MIMSFSIVSLTGDRGSVTRSEFMDTELFKTRILDWINQERARNELSGINLDQTLSDIAYNEAVKIANADINEYEILISRNDTNVVNSYGYQCPNNDDKTKKFFGILSASEHIKFYKVEPVVNWYLSQSMNHQESKELILNADFKTTGIGIAMSTEKFYVLQFFC